jgi:hypothetical protein
VNKVWYGTVSPSTATNPANDQGNGYTHYVNITGRRRLQDFQGRRDCSRCDNNCSRRIQPS